jgi:DNA-binding phage protein
VQEAEANLADHIREALAEGGSVTKIARAAGLSRERIYQIRDRRR